MQLHPDDLRKYGYGELADVLDQSSKGDTFMIYDSTGRLDALGPWLDLTKGN